MYDEQQIHLTLSQRQCHSKGGQIYLQATFHIPSTNWLRLFTVCDVFILCFFIIYIFNNTNNIPCRNCVNFILLLSFYLHNYIFIRESVARLM